MVLVGSTVAARSVFPFPFTTCAQQLVVTVQSTILCALLERGFVSRRARRDTRLKSFRVAGPARQDPGPLYTEQGTVYCDRGNRSTDEISRETSNLLPTSRFFRSSRKFRVVFAVVQRRKYFCNVVTKIGRRHDFRPLARAKKEAWYASVNTERFT